MATNRLQRKVRDIEKGLIENDDSYLSAEHALINWGRWNRSIATPMPRSTAKASSLYSQIPSTPDEDDEMKVQPIIDEAELTEKLILKGCSRRDKDMFIATYIHRMTKEETLLYMRKRRHRHAHRDSYRRFLDAALSKLSVLIDEHWDIPSATVIPNRGQSESESDEYRRYQVSAIKRQG